MALISTTMNITLTSGETITQGDVDSTPNYVDASASATTPLTNGTGSGQAQYTISNIIAAATDGTTIDLSAMDGGLNGSTRNFSKIKAWKIENLDPSNTVTIGNATSNTWTGISGTTNINKVIQPGGCIGEVEPDTGLIVTSTNKILVLTASVPAINTRISLVGLGT